MSAKRGHVVGLNHAMVWRVDEAGFATGITGTPTAGVEMYPHVLEFPQSAVLPAASRVVTPLRGGNQWRGQVMFGIDDLGSFPLVLGDLDAAFHALAGDSVVDQTTNARWTRFSDNQALANTPQLGMLLSTIYQSRERGSDGVNMWINYFIPRCQVSPGWAGMAYQAAGDTTYTVSPTYASTEPTGLGLGSTAMKLAQDRAVAYAIVTPHPLALATMIGAGTETSMDLQLEPIGTDTTLNDSPNELVLNGAPTAPASVTITPNAQVTFAALTAGDRVGFLYETNMEVVS